MSVFSTLDSAFGSAVQSVSNDAGNIVGSVLSGVQVQIKTNLGPAFLVGGLATNSGTDGNGNATQSTSPGLLSAFGLKYNVTILGADGKPITTIGDPPATDPAVIAYYSALTLGVAYLIYRGVRSLVRP